MHRSLTHANLLVLSEERNALDYLRKAHEYLGKVCSDSVAWKWVVIALDGALYGFAICALKGTNPHRVMKAGREVSVPVESIPNDLDVKSLPPYCKAIDCSPKRRLKYKGIMTFQIVNQLLGLSNDSPYQEAVISLYEKTHEIISFFEALKRCQDPQWMRMTVKSKILVMRDSQKTSVDTLHKMLRNNFEHYGPRAWLIETSGMPQIVADVMQVIRFLALDTGNYVNLNEREKREIKSIVFQSKRLLKELAKDTVKE